MLELLINNPEYQDMAISSIFSQGLVHFWRIQMDDPIEPNVIYVNEKKRIPREGLSKVGIPPNASKELRGNLIDEFASMRQNELVEWNSSVLFGNGYLVSDEIAELTLGQYVDEVKDRFSDGLKEKIEIANERIGLQSVDDNDIDEMWRSIVEDRLDADVVPYGHLLLSVNINISEEQRGLTLTPVLLNNHGAQYVGMKDYNPIYDGQQDTLTRQTDFPFELHEVQNLSMSLPDEKIDARFRIANMTRLAGGIKFSEDAINDLEELGFGKPEYTIE